MNHSRVFDVQPGIVIGKCRLERELGRGGMGTVWLGQHETLGVPVAVKLLPPDIAARDAQFRERFQREARVAAQLRHPNVVAVMDVDEDPATGLHYIVQEYCAGGSLRAQIPRQGSGQPPFAEADALRVLRDIGLALQAAAKIHVVHRDIKPDNILIDDEGRAKLADLGLVRYTPGAPAADEDLTASDATLGTPSFMSPEQVNDPRAVDSRSDLYSLGATFFFLLLGRPPFLSDSLFRLMQAIIGEPPPLLSDYRTDLHDDTVQICNRLLAKDPADRFATPTDMLTALKKHGRPPRGRLSFVVSGATAGGVPSAAPMTVNPTDRERALATVGDGTMAATRSGQQRAVPARARHNSRDRNRFAVWITVGPGVALLLALVLVLNGGSDRRPTDDERESVSVADDGDPDVHSDPEPDPDPRPDPEPEPGSQPEPKFDPEPRPDAARMALARGLQRAFSFEPGTLAGTRVRNLIRGDADGSVVGGVSVVRAGPVGQAIQFDGSGGSRVEIPAAPIGTIALWVQVDDDQAMTFFDGGTSQAGELSGLILGSYPSPAPFPHWRIDPTRPGFTVGFWQLDALIPQTTTAGWRHLAVALDGNAVRIAIDGRPADAWLVRFGADDRSRSRDGELRLPRPTVLTYDGITLGRLQTAHPQLPPFRGRIDEVAIWDRALSMAELTSLAGFASRDESYAEVLAALANR